MGMAAGMTDLPDVPVVGAAAAPEHPQVRQKPRQRAVVAGELAGSPGIELGRRVELGMAELRGVGPHPADPPDPARRPARRGSASDARS